MRLINKEVVCNEETFAPELRVTVALSIEPQLDRQLSEEEIATTLGKQLFDILKNT